LLLVGWALGVKLLRSCLQQGAVQFASWFWGNPLQKGRVTDKVAIQCNSSLFSGLERPWWAGTPLGLVLPSILFCWKFRRKKCILTGRARNASLVSAIFFAEFIGACSESLQKTALVMGLQRLDAPTVFHSACPTRCAFSGVM
jgi:hypothetical protein